MIKTFKNTERFRQPALHFEEHGYYTNAVEGTKEWEEYWDTQYDRCLNGYESEGTKITGYHYWYLNFFPMMRIPKDALTGESEVAVKNEGFPAFYDGDYNYFWLVEIARNGISPEEYEKLGLKIDIHPDDLSGGLHIAVLKARRKGYSYKNASMISRNYHLIPESKNYAFADDKEFLLKDGLLHPKTWQHMEWMKDNTAFGQPRLIDGKLHRFSGYKTKVEKGYVERGKKSQIIGVTLKNDPEKSRGKDGDVLLFEEAGKLPDLKKSWKIAKETVGQGKFTTGLMICFGTGGEEGADFEGLEEIFMNPEAYGVIRVRNQWDDGAHNSYCGFFHSAAWNFEGFMDADGNSDEEAAKAFIMNEREKAKQAPDPNALSQYVSEQPLNPQEATTQADINILPTAELQAQLNSVKANERWKFGTPGILYEAEEGVKFRPSDDVKPIMNYPHQPKDNLEGGVVIYQSPFRTNGKVPKGMYIVCHDPYAQNTSVDGKSLGSAYVLKRTNRLDQTLNECIVASYVGRPGMQDEYNRNLFMLADYYNAKIGFENDRGDVIGYAKRFHKLHKLEEQFEMLDKKELQSKNVKRPYGMHMTKQRKEQGEIYIRDWLMTPVTNYDDGSTKLVVHTIFDPALLQELIKYNKDGNFDRVLSLMVGMYHQKELYNKKVVETQAAPHEDFFLSTNHFN